MAQEMKSSKGDEYPINKSHVLKLANIPKSWMVRECNEYYEEYRQCKSMAHKFHSYYVEGKVSSCDSWKKNFDDCNLWCDKADEEAIARVIEREEARITQRLEGHLANNVWEKRTEPPMGWNAPLPDHLAIASENSYLMEYKLILEEKNSSTAADSNNTLRLREMNARISTALPGCTIL